MMDWFEWNGVRCTQYGIHVLEQPSITIPSERVTFTDVPGRSGSLTQLEGDDVYDDISYLGTPYGENDMRDRMKTECKMSDQKAEIEAARVSSNLRNIESAEQDIER